MGEQRTASLSDTDNYWGDQEYSPARKFMNIGEMSEDIYTTLYTTYNSAVSMRVQKSNIM